MSRSFKDSAGLYRWVNNTNYCTEDIRAVVEHVVKDMMAVGVITDTPDGGRAVVRLGRGDEFRHGLRTVTFRETKAASGDRRFPMKRMTYMVEQGQPTLVVDPGYYNPEICFVHPTKWNMTPVQVISDEGRIRRMVVEQLAESVLWVFARGQERWKGQLTPVLGLTLSPARGQGPKVTDGLMLMRRIRQSQIAYYRTKVAQKSMANLLQRLKRTSKNGVQVQLADWEMSALWEAYAILAKLKDCFDDDNEAAVAAGRSVG
jgi:hypothetical protein